MTDELRYEPKTGLHQDLVPKGIVGRDTSKLRVIHYGFATDEALLAKYRTYESYGQNGVALDRLIDESTLRLAEADKAWFSDSDWPHGPGVDIYNVKLREKL